MGEADILRRAMSGKYRSGNKFSMIRDKYFVSCKSMGHPDDLAKEVWRQMESFAGYSFSKAHSASFAVESYQSLYLKTYYPKEFMVAVINNFGGFYPTELYFHELKRAGAIVNAPCVNHSGELTSIKGDDVYVGLTHIQNLEKETVDKVLAQRSKYGSYISLQDFIERTGLGIEQMTILIRIGALKFTGKSKKTLLWEANLVSKKSKSLELSAGRTLFQEDVKEFVLPEFHQDPYEDALDEIELLGFPLCNMFELVNVDLKNFTTAKDFHQNVGKVIDVLGYFITSKPVLTIKKQYMFFGTFIDHNGDWIDSVHFPDVADKYSLGGKGFYHLKGKVVEEFGVNTLEVQVLTKVSLKFT
jgi:DNA polymerase-3 subunit alpha